ncbi:hypothetical protein PSTG_09778 [Puccinia striiformis f. sp. tritici PST-78]|uniref:Crinkler (CRN) family protein n=1 Tax=Puccinia striiformis f. sp. tritici PST-78 TaxID=1165861 RepID=A0A0L0VC81_9BASI|nr:hypothetical protein PSTG_09778 [Puccinia striiformis f. sp. tritici PST-78]
MATSDIPTMIKQRMELLSMIILSEAYILIPVLASILIFYSRSPTDSLAFGLGAIVATVTVKLKIASETTPVKLKVEEDIVRFWKALPDATLVSHGEMQYLELKDSFVLGNEELGRRFLVRSIYRELCDHLERPSCQDKWVVTGTPGIGKTIFSAYYLWIAARKQKTVVWQPFQSQNKPSKTYLMTSGGVQRVALDSNELVDALANSETVYIVDGQAPITCNAWTLLVTPPQYDNYKDLLKEQAFMLYMVPWSYEELLNRKTHLYSDEKALPTTLMERLFEWYGGVPRYVLALPSSLFESLGGKEDDVGDVLVAELTCAIKKHKVSDIVSAHQDRNRAGAYSHRVLHIWNHPGGNPFLFRVAWASRQVESAVLIRLQQESRTDLRRLLQTSGDYGCGNVRGMVFESHAHDVLQGGGRFKVRQLCKGQDPPIDPSVEVTFPTAQCKFFQDLEDVDLGTNLLWWPHSKSFPSIDSLCGPANLFQMTVSQKHPINHQGLSKALKRVDTSESHPRLYFVVPPDVFGTFECQPYHKNEGTVFGSGLGAVAQVEQWALMIPTDVE